MRSLHFYNTPSYYQSFPQLNWGAQRLNLIFNYYVLHSTCFYIYYCNTL